MTNVTEPNMVYGCQSLDVTAREIEIMNLNTPNLVAYTKEKKQKFLEKINLEGLNPDLIFDVYNFYKRHFDDTVDFLLPNKNSIDYSPNVYKIQSIISNKVVEENELHENIKQSYRNRAQSIQNSSIFVDKWEDEPLPEKVYGVAKDFDEFLNVFLNENINNWSPHPQPREELNEMLNQIKPYFIGFLTLHTFIYDHKSYDCKTVILSKDELVNYCSNLNNCLLYGVYLLKEPDKFKLRYGQIDE